MIDDTVFYAVIDCKHFVIGSYVLDALAQILQTMTRGARYESRKILSRNLAP